MFNRRNKKVVPNTNEQSDILKQIADQIKASRLSVTSIACKIACAEDNVGLLYRANWTLAGNHVLLQYTNVASESQGLPSAFYFDGVKNYFIELESQDPNSLSKAHVLTGSAPFGEPSPLRSSYFFYGSWFDELIGQHKAKISEVRETEEHGLVYDIRIEIPRRVLMVEVAPKYNFAIVKTSELRSDGEIINEASSFAPYGETWLPAKSEFNSKWTHNDITSSWHRSYAFSDITVNSVPDTAAQWSYAEGSVITDGIYNSKVVLIDGKWESVSPVAVTSG